MEYAFLVIIVGLIIVLGFLILKKKDQGGSDQIMLMSSRIDTLVRDLTDGMQNVRKEMQSSLHDNSKTLNTRLDNAARVIGGVENKLGKLEESSRQIQEIGKDISTLQTILKAPKLRGALGEFFLGDLLGQVLPKDHFTLQYPFRNGTIVDAIVRLNGESIVSIDSKFPLENFIKIVEAQTDEVKKIAKKEFVRDVRKHIDAIASKYILSDEGTLDFAFMYIPAENVYYEMITKDEDMMEICTYAFSKKVIPISPNNFYAYLQTILMGMRGMQIEKHAREIVSNLNRLQGDFGKFKEDFSVVGKHLGNASTKFNDAERRLDKFEDKLLSSGNHVEEIEQPALLP